jgi:hypothetical protein
MTLTFLPDKPGMKTTFKYIGYWAKSADPADCSYFDRGLILPWPGHFVDTSWDPKERNLVAAYLDGKPDIERWRGFSACRLCTGKLNGTTDKGDGVYVWPEGFSHYVREHSVKPPAEFLQRVLRTLW